MWLLVVTAVAVWPPVTAGGQEDLYMEHMYSHYLQQEARYHGHHQALFTFYYHFSFVHCSNLCFIVISHSLKPYVCTLYMFYDITDY